MSTNGDIIGLSSLGDNVELSSLVDNLADGAMIRTISQFAAAVRARRIERGWTQQELARRAGVSRSWLNDFETGKPRAETRLILKVLDALNLDIVLVPRVRGEDDIDLDDVLGRFGSP